MTRKHGLGRGLKALIKDAPAIEAEGPEKTGTAAVPVDKIEANTQQPRQEFAEEAMRDLVSSVSERGIVQPLLVRRKGEAYELIAGERRLRAAKEAGLTEVPVVVVEASDQDSLELALVENLQRQDLNVVEEAEGYKALAEKFSLTQEQIAARVGKARASVANTIRLLDLPARIVAYLRDGRLSAGHAKVLLGVEMQEDRVSLAERTVREALSVRNLEKLVEKRSRVPRKPRAMRDDIPRSHVSHLNDALRKHFGTGVTVNSCRTLADGKKAKGSVEIEFYSAEDLDRVLEMLGVSLDEDA